MICQHLLMSILMHYSQYLNSNPSLYHAVVKAEQNHHMLTEEALRAAHHLRIDLEKGGIHLSPGTDLQSSQCFFFFFFLFLIC